MQAIYKIFGILKFETKHGLIRIRVILMNWPKIIKTKKGKQYLPSNQAYGSIIVSIIRNVIVLNQTLETRGTLD